MRTYSADSLPTSLRRLVRLGIAFSLTALTTLIPSPALSLRLCFAQNASAARNPERLHLLLDSTKVLGWISGVRDYTGATVTITASGVRQSLRVERGNTFTWPYQVAKDTEAVFALGRLRQTILLRPQAKEPPCVFFIVDRGVYRPKQTLRFAGFLRDLDARGEFVPRPGQTVDVLLTSERKKSITARLRLTADRQGRIIGEYTFSDADPLDSYRLTIPEYKGEAHISLAAYRKSKVHLNILSQHEGSRLNLRFQARDYLNQPVKGARVEFIAQVVREAVQPPAAGPLNGKQFAYAGDNGPPVLRLEDLTAEERVMADADDGQEAVGGLNVGLPRKVVNQFQAKLDLNEQGEGVYPVELRRHWLEPGHVLVVRGVMIDSDGREERRTKTIALTDAADRLRLSMSQSSYHAGEPIVVTAHTSDRGGLQGSLTLVVTRLTAGVPALPKDVRGVADGTRGVGGLPSPIVMADWGAVRRTLATTVIFRGDTATLRLHEPGPYMFTALWLRPDGSRVRQEIGCAVLAPADAPALALHLDRESYQSGDTLTGTVTSKYAGARVLLTLRDAVGLRLWKILRLDRGQADVKLELPAGLRYGCAVEVQYADAEGEPAHVASRIVHVVPAERMLKIQSTLKPILKPGENTVLDLQVNRNEPVDLIVSVYDKALLNLAPDRSPDVRNFYLADERIYQDHAREVLRRRLGSMTLLELVQRARAWLRTHSDRALTVESTAVQALANWTRRNDLRTPEVAALLRAAGIRARAVDAEHAWKVPPLAHARRMTAWEWLNTVDKSGWHLHFGLAGDTLFLTAYHPTENPQPWDVRATIFYPASVLRVGNGGMGGFGGIGGAAGIGGLGAQGFNQLGAQGGFQGNFQGRNNLGVGGGVVGFGRGMMGMGGLGGLTPGPAAPVRTPVLRTPRGPTLLDSDGEWVEMPVRRDFADSAYWNAQLRTDAAGKARVEFKLPDSLTGWQVVITAISKDMHVGRHETSFQTAKSIMVNPILPRFFTEGDKVRVSAGVHNRTDTRQTIRVRLKADNGKVQTPAEQEIAIEPRGSASVSWDFQAGDAGSAELLMSAEAKAGSDASLKRLPVVRAGVEHVETASGFCKDAATINLPEGVDPREVVFEVRFVPTLTADLLDTLNYLVEFPYGCVEQTMSRFLPAIKVAQVLKQLHLDSPDLNKKLPGCVEAGIKRLLELQHTDGGWGWWTNDPTHEIMTPYALYGLLEAEKAGYRIASKDAIQRGLRRLREFIDHIGPNQAADRIYCLYVYGQCQDLTEEWWTFIDKQRVAGKLSDYALALSLELAVRHKQRRLAHQLATDLRDRARRSAGQVHWRTAHFSHWADDPFEVTAAALKALVAYDKDHKLIPDVLAYFVATKRDNRWNSTKDTAMIVYALCDCLACRELDPRGAPSIAFRCNDGPLQKVPFPQPSESRKILVPSGQLRAGVNRVTFAENTPGMMYRIALRYWRSGRGVPAESHGIKVTRRYWLLDDKGQRQRELKSGEQVSRGAYLESTIEAQPTDPDGTMRYVLVENPRPAGCEVVPAEDRRFDQQGTPHLLREDREKLVAYHHDQTTGRIVDRCVLHTELPGDYLVPAAHVEMMYQTEVRGHSGTFAFRVAEK